MKRLVLVLALCLSATAAHANFFLNTCNFDSDGDILDGMGMGDKVHLVFTARVLYTGRTSVRGTITSKTGGPTYTFRGSGTVINEDYDRAWYEGTATSPNGGTGHFDFNYPGGTYS